MACADLVITKPGGLSTSECLVMGLPMVLINPIPGQEERNAAVLLQEGVAIRADDADALLYRTQQLLANEEKFNQMKIRARALAKPDAAKVVMQHVIGHLAQAPTSRGV
jgi:processive 1,2-diacylglycerol beta-glucosyltransferase